jgi:hypothetical protein
MPTLSEYAEGNTDECAIASTRPIWRGRRTWHVQTFLARESGELTTGQDTIASLVRIGKARSRSR